MNEAKDYAEPYVTVRLVAGSRVKLTYQLDRQQRRPRCKCVHDPATCCGGWTEQRVFGRPEDVLVRCGCFYADAGVCLRETAAEGSEGEWKAGWEDGMSDMSDMPDMLEEGAPGEAGMGEGAPGEGMGEEGMGDQAMGDEGIGEEGHGRGGHGRGGHGR